MRSHNSLHRRVKHTTKVTRGQTPPKFTQKNVEFSETPLFFPEGFEKLFLAIYFVTLPYIAGILFLFFYVASGSLDTFSSLNKEHSFILTWAIGYEIIASLILLWIFKMSLSFANKSTKPSIQQKFRRP